jgi:RHS repeat-associated protein
MSVHLSTPRVNEELNPMRQRLTVFSLAVFLILLAAPAAWAARDAVMARGFYTDHVYDVKDVDSINVFNGTLNLAVPLGAPYQSNGSLRYQFVLRYSSNLWDYASHNGGKTDVGYSAVGEYTYDPFDDTSVPGSPVTDGAEAYPAQQFNAGFGWSVTLGELKQVIYNGQIHLVYIDAEGSEHSFFDQLHQGPTPPAEVAFNASVAYTRDGSYIRIRSTGANKREVDLPDGVVQRFSCTADCGAAKAQWYLDEIADPFGSLLVITRSSAVRPAPGTPWIWTYSEYMASSEGYKTRTDPSVPSSPLRSHTVKLTVVRASTWSAEVRVDEVDLAAVNGATATYVFHYNDDVRIYRDWQSNWAASDGLYVPFNADGTIFVSLLDHVDLPPNSGQSVPSGQWRFRYINTCGDDCTTRMWNTFSYKVSRVSGRLEVVGLPSGGAFRYTYAPRAYPKSLCNHNDASFATFTSVSLREKGTLDGNGNFTRQGTLTDTWHYFARSYALADDICIPDEFVATVVDPAGKATVSFFSIFTGDSAAGGWRISEHGMALTHRDLNPPPAGIVGNRALSESIYDCSGANLFAIDSQVDGNIRRIARARVGETATCGTPRRSTYVRYESSIPATNSGCTLDMLEVCASSNRRLQSALTIDYDDSATSGLSYTQADNSDFDGFGHYRTSDQGGNLAQQSFGGPVESLQSRTTYNDGIVYTPGGTVSSYPSPWNLGTYGEQSWWAGNIKFTERARFDANTGRLLARRRLQSVNGILDGRDLLVTFDRTIEPALKAVSVTEQYFGGDSDSQKLSVTAAFDVPSAGAEYTIRKRSISGGLARSEYLGCDPLVVENNDVDLSTGLVTVSRDAWGIATTYAYDRLGRLTDLDAPGQAPMKYVYPNLPQQTTLFARRRNGSSTVDEAQYDFDGFGDLVTERHDIPSGGTSRRDFVYDVMGRKTRETVVGLNSDSQLPTACSAYDIFGRLVSQTQPAGAGECDQKKRTEFVWNGPRTVDRVTHDVATAFGAHDVTSSRSFYDSFQRLAGVSEHSSGGSQAACEPNTNCDLTRYTYDAEGRLITVDQGAQQRAFAYDGRGFLASESHPELAGVAVTHGRYDARGNERERFYGSSTSPFDLTFSYDGAEELTAVWQRTPNASAPLKTFSYDRGRIKTARRINHIPDPRATSRMIDRGVVVNLEYDQSSGQLLKRKLNSGFRAETIYSYEPLFGQVATVTYPNVVTCKATCTSMGPNRTITSTFAHDAVTSVIGFVPSLTYNANGTVGSLSHAVGSGTLVEELLSDVVPRLRKATVRRNGTQVWTSGEYVYDGAGNVRSIQRAGAGNDDFAYDAVGRLTGANLAHLPGEPSGSSYAQAFTYDRWGNMKSMATNGLSTTFGVNAATNRMAGSYEIDGSVSLLSGDPRRPGFEQHFDHDAFGSVTRAETFQNSALNGGRVFLYDAFDERIASIAYGHADGPGSAPPITETWTIRGADNAVLRELTKTDSGGWQWSADYVYAGTRLAALVRAGASGQPEAVNHVHLDNLGSVRAVTDASGSVVDTRRYLPFGEEMSPRADTNRIKFAGQERDDDGTSATVGDIDYMHARYYAATSGRFLAVDPGKDWDSSVPQSWNLYAYVRNNPIDNTDATGREITCDPEKKSCRITADTYSAEHSTGKTAEVTQQMQDAAAKGLSKVAVPPGSPEKMAFGMMRDGKLTVEAATDVQTKGAQAKAPVPAGAVFGMHGHIDGGPNSGAMADDPAENQGFGDTQTLSLKNPIPMATVSKGQIGWHGIKDGQLFFTGPQSLSNSQKEKIQKALNREQKLPAFWKP